MDQLSVPGLSLLERLHDGTNSVVFRARREGTESEEAGAPLVLKLLKEEYPSPRRVARFKREFEVTRGLDFPGVVKPSAIERVGPRWMMILEDFGGDSLRRLRLAGDLEPARFLDLATRITEILAQLHRRGVVHKDINPSNIVLNPETEEVKIIDFGISTVLEHERQAFHNPAVLEGTLAYISPEQTGRINRSIDYRTDFYSLGVSFYELLTGRLPFPGEDPLDILHGHIAREAPPPRELDPAIPRAISDVVMKLMAKSPDERYQSAAGLLADLSRCRELLEEGDRGARFELGRDDISDRFHVSQTLYGRDREIERLLAAFARAAAGGRELMLVAGYSGIGKSMLVREVYRPITEQRGFFISGKYEQLQRNIPYSAFIQAFRALVLSLLSESGAQIARWRERILAALSGNGQIIIDVIPEVERVIGPQPPVQALEGREARNRFNVIFLDFIAVFANAKHPLVIFLDDLQWADGGSMSLLKLLMESPKNDHLMVIGAYRDNEVDETHALSLTLAELAVEEEAVHTLTLGPLGLPEVTRLIADTLRQSPEEVAPLAELALAKTRGNPFFLNAFLSTLHRGRLIRFDHDLRRWRWDASEIEAEEMTDNVVELMLAHTRTLPPRTQERLMLAACVGGRFGLRTLAMVAEESPREVATALWPAIEQGLIQPLGDAYKLVELEVEGLEDDLDAEYKFVHDRVQQAAYSLATDEERTAIHWRAGRTMLAHTPEEERWDRIFDIVNQLDQGRMHAKDEASRLELSELNRMASEKAKAAIAFEPAYSYNETAIELLTGGQILDRQALERANEGASPASQERLLSLYVEATELAYLKTDYVQVDRLAEIVESLTEDPVILARVFDAKIASNFAQMRYLESIKVGLSILERLGFSFPFDPTDADIGAALASTAAALEGKVIEELIDLPRMTDERIIAAMRIISALVPAVYVSRPPLFPIITLKQVELSVEHGNNNQSPVAYCCYALILCGIVGEIDDGYRFGLLSEELLAKLDAKERYAMTTAISNCGARHWKEPVLDTAKDMPRAYRAGVDAGDLEYAAISLEVYCYHCYYAGRALPLLEPEIGGYVEAIHNIGLSRTKRNCMSYQQACQNLMGRSEEPWVLKGEVGDSEEWEKIALEADDHHALGTLYLHRTMLANLFRRYEEAARYTELSVEKLFASPGFCYQAVIYFHDSLVQLALYEEAGEEKKASIRERVEANQAKMRVWADHAPFNQLHRWHLVEAERARVEGRGGEAREHYDEAIRLSQEHGYLHEEGLCQELAGRFYLAKGNKRIARVYLADARFAYEQWGAGAKVWDITETYGLREAAPAEASGLSGTQTTGTTGGTGNQALDLEAVLAATQAISSEVVLDTLIDRVMTVVIKSAGAERASLLLEEDGRLLLRAASSADQGGVHMVEALPLEELADEGELALPRSIVHYAARLKDDVVLADAAEKGDFTRDPYVLAKRPRSILCVPIVQQGELLGVLYLENNLTTGAFTDDRVALLRMLSAQAAISLENARLYSNLEALTAAQRRFVPYQFLENLGQPDIAQVHLGQHVAKRMTVMFSDIRGFTPMTERLDATEVVDLLNDYFCEMEPAIVDHGGFIDAFTGDEIMALFDASPEQAVRAGIAMQKALAAMNARRGGAPMVTGTGVATGNLLLTTVGGRDRMKCGVVGDVVNLASRIEQLTKHYGAPMLISEHTYRSLPDPSRFAIRMVDRVAVKGKVKPATVYEVIDAETEERRAAKMATLASVSEALERYFKRDFTGALGLFAAAKGKMQDDLVPSVFFHRCLRYIESPPPEDWQGFEKMTTR